MPHQRVPNRSSCVGKKHPILYTLLPLLRLGPGEPRTIQRRVVRGASPSRASTDVRLSMHLSLVHTARYPPAQLQELDLLKSCYNHKYTRAPLGFVRWLHGADSRCEPCYARHASASRFTGRQHKRGHEPAPSYRTRHAQSPGLDGKEERRKGTATGEALAPLTALAPCWGQSARTVPHGPASPVALQPHAPPSTPHPEPPPTELGR